MTHLSCPRLDTKFVERVRAYSTTARACLNMLDAPGFRRGTSLEARQAANLIREPTPVFRRPIAGIVPDSGIMMNDP